ncbi:MAG: hypothetical protein LBG69_03305 [Zoogloeaceae bacterium]|jgi:MSHA biogenesis protein MshP|nr:hypothetical protein [Zoogloeaceae bacterium]
MRSHLHSVRGLGAIMALVILVILSLLAAALTRFSSTQQLTSAQDILSSHAWNAARSGSEWALYVVIEESAANREAGCASVNNTTPNLAGFIDSRFSVRVKCEVEQYTEGARPISVFTITTIACNAASCPNDAASASAGYVERVRTVIATPDI